MSGNEMYELFDVLYNNTSSNQAPGLNIHEISLFLTKAQDEKVKNHFTANSKGNDLGQGFDDSSKRQMDFSVLMQTLSCTSTSLVGTDNTVQYSYKAVESNGAEITKTALFKVNRIDGRSRVYAFPPNVFIPINETFVEDSSKTFLQVIPLRYDEYTRLMSKPFKRPLEGQAWRLINSGHFAGGEYNKCVEIIAGPQYDGADKNFIYTIRYIRRPKPIIIGNLDGLKIDGYDYGGDVTPDTPAKDKIYGDHVCELDPEIHQEIVQRAVELAKIAWQGDLQAALAGGQRSE